MCENETQWKIELDYNIMADKFALSINGVPFDQMPYQAEVVSEGPQNIEEGEIKLNEMLVHKGFACYDAETILGWIDRCAQPVTDISIGGVSCNSPFLLG